VPASASNAASGLKRQTSGREALSPRRWRPSCAQAFDLPGDSSGSRRSTAGS